MCVATKLKKYDLLYFENSVDKKMKLLQAIKGDEKEPKHSKQQKNTYFSMTLIWNIYLLIVSYLIHRPTSKINRYKKGREEGVLHRLNKKNHFKIVVYHPHKLKLNV